MKNLKSLYLDKMLYDLCDIDQNGIPLKTQSTKAPLPKEVHNPMNYELPGSITELYNQFHFLEFHWFLQQKDAVIERIKTDPFIQKNYLSKEEFTWEMINEYLSGYINITPSDQIFDPNFCKSQGYYYWLSGNSKAGNADDFFPLDTSADVTACIRKENNGIADNVWLIYPDAEKVYNMNVSVETYFDLAYQARGMRMWQMVYLFREKSPHFELMKWFLPAINPNAKPDLTLFGM
ncbi:MAG: hypothetical protein ACRC3B_20760 [Bacteroidia bacterium]